MRTLLVLEVRNLLGEFVPKIGFGDEELLREWMVRNLSDTVRNQTSEWRIIQYIPASTEPDPNLIH